MRKAEIKRETLETKIEIKLKIDGQGNCDIKTGVGFFDHMLKSFCRHGHFDVNLVAKGDLEVDAHHTVEDTGIALGDAFRKALGDFKGINRAGSFAFPMDEALTLVAIDISGRSYVGFDYEFKRERVGDLDTELVKEFFNGFARGLGATIHVVVMRGENTHHIIESIFKSFGRALKEATGPSGADGIPSTKGVI